MTDEQAAEQSVRHTLFPVFKGATRPAMVLGVPSGAFITAAVLIFMPAIWISPVIAIAFLPVLLVMRRIAKKDDYRFHQIGLAILIFTPLRANRALWRGFMSLSPFLAGGDARRVTRFAVSEPRREADSPARKRAKGGIPEGDFTT